MGMIDFIFHFYKCIWNIDIAIFICLGRDDLFDYYGVMQSLEHWGLPVPITLYVVRQRDFYYPGRFNVCGEKRGII